VESFFVCSNAKYAAMLRHEASVSDETDTSCLSMTEAKKTCNKSRTTIAEGLLNQSFSKNINHLRQENAALNELIFLIW
jgi:hypothetical protein